MNLVASIQLPLIIRGTKRIGRAVSAVALDRWRWPSRAGKAVARDISVDVQPDGDTGSVMDTIQPEVADQVQAMIDPELVMDRLIKSASNLTAICRDTESDFLDLGQRLNTIQGEAGSLTNRVVTMLAADQEHNIQSALKKIQHTTLAANQELNQRRIVLSEDLHGLNTIRKDLAHLLDQNKSFKQVAKNLKMVGLNIAIESARSNEAKTHFQALAEEIVQLAQTVSNVAGHISDDTGNAQANMEKIQSEIGLRMNHLDSLIRSTEQTVNQALQDVDNLLQLTITVLDGIGAKAQEIGKQVGHLVVSIQIHDNISQRVAHIQTAVEEAVHLIKTSTMADPPHSGLKAIYGKVYGIIRLQMAQVQTINEDMATVRDQCVDALQKLETAVKEVAQPPGFSFSDNGSVAQIDTDDCHHPVMVLLDALNLLLDLFDKGLNDTRLLTHARRETSQTIAKMECHIGKVREINFDIHLKALNAVVKSTRLGSTGKSIEALVIEMKELAERSNATIVSATEIMEKVTSASERMDGKQRHGDTETSAADLQLRHGIADFTTDCNHFKATSKQTIGMGCQLQDKTKLARENLDFFDRLLSTFQYHHEEFRQVGDSLTSFAGNVSQDWIEEEINILKRYTMQRERDAHAKMIDGYSQAPTELDPHFQLYEAPGDSTRNDFPEEVLDDNVELF